MRTLADKLPEKKKKKITQHLQSLSLPPTPKRSFQEGGGQGRPVTTVSTLTLALIQKASSKIFTCSEISFPSIFVSLPHPELFSILKNVQSCDIHWHPSASFHRSECTLVCLTLRLQPRFFQIMCRGAHAKRRKCLSFSYSLAQASLHRPHAAKEPRRP